MIYEEIQTLVAWGKSDWASKKKIVYLSTCHLYDDVVVWDESAYAWRLLIAWNKLERSCDGRCLLYSEWQSLLGAIQVMQPIV